MQSIAGWSGMERYRHDPVLLGLERENGHAGQPVAFPVVGVNAKVCTYLWDFNFRYAASPIWSELEGLSICLWAK
jgi:hypothetical protein